MVRTGWSEELSLRNEHFNYKIQWCEDGAMWTQYLKNSSGTEETSSSIIAARTRLGVWRKRKLVSEPCKSDRERGSEHVPVSRVWRPW